MTGCMADFIHLRIHLSMGIKDRDFVQERFLVEVKNDGGSPSSKGGEVGGGYAIMIKSCSPETAQALGKPEVRGVVRATTLISGYILRRHSSGGIHLQALSQLDIGGKIPQWAQTMGKKASK